MTNKTINLIFNLNDEKIEIEGAPFDNVSNDEVIELIENNNDMVKSVKIIGSADTVELDAKKNIELIKDIINIYENDLVSDLNVIFDNNTYLLDDATKLVTRGDYYIYENWYQIVDVFIESNLQVIARDTIYDYIDKEKIIAELQNSGNFYKNDNGFIIEEW